VYLVGAGPGDPELLTLKAARLIAAADVIVYDRLVSADVLTLAREHAQVIFAGKRQGQQEEIQSEIYRLLEKLAARVEMVVRLKGGDPMVFGRGAEEWMYLNARRIDVELVPGVSAALAVPALAGIPLTCRGVAASFAVIAGHRQNMRPAEWKQYRDIDTLVVLMGVENRELIARNLMLAGRRADEPVAFITRGSTDRQEVVTSTLSAAAGVTVESPAIFVIGEVVRLRKRLTSVVGEVEALAD
jgi:uroporphyrin-III C-methyltransferase